MVACRTQSSVPTAEQQRVLGGQPAEAGLHCHSLSSKNWDDLDLSELDSLILKNLLVAKVVVLDLGQCAENPTQRRRLWMFLGSV